MKAIPTDIKTIQSEKVPKKIPDKKEKQLTVSYLSMILDQYKRMAREKKPCRTFTTSPKAYHGKSTSSAIPHSWLGPPRK
ncbi:MAG: hypothetical protein ABIA63_00265 [bacterium]